MEVAKKSRSRLGLNDQHINSALLRSMPQPKTKSKKLISTKCANCKKVNLCYEYVVTRDLLVILTRLDDFFLL